MKEKIASPGGSPYKTLNNGSYDNNGEKPSGPFSSTTKASGKTRQQFLFHVIFTLDLITN